MRAGEWSAVSRLDPRDEGGEEGGSEKKGRRGEGEMYTLFPSWLWSLCICRHCPRYIKLSLIFPASANVAPAVLAFLARSDPARSTTVMVAPLHRLLIPPLTLLLTSTTKKP